ncbi:NADPH:quinone reductase [Streptomyces sp. NBC_00105]|uniref:NADPH:quinone reductase n=1 Tax=Streptomyces sp. NBC_00105 TaxID=2903622 RepID=UPI0032431FC2
MRAAWYEKKGPAAKVLETGEMDAPVPGPGEVRIRLRYSGINPGDVKKRQTWLGAERMPYPRVVPHNDGSGVVDLLGPGTPAELLGRRVWCSYAQSYRPHGTAAEYTTVPAHCVGPLPEEVTAEQGACLGIPGITAHRAVFADGPVTGRTVLVVGGRGAVGRSAVALAARGGARVIATVTGPPEPEPGADHVLTIGDGLADRVRDLTGGRGVDRIVEVAFDANVTLDAELLAQGGTLATYATGEPRPPLPFWPLAFSNATVRLLGYDDFPPDAVRAAIKDVTAAAAAGALRHPIAQTFALEAIAAAHEALEHPSVPGRVLLSLPA